jgi:uncharacterized protein YciI
MPMFSVSYRPGPRWMAGVPTTQQPLRPHAEYLHGLMGRGHVVLAGPYPDSGGLAILEAATLDSVRILVDSDPAITSGVLCADVNLWTPIFDRANGLDPLAGPAGARKSAA